MVNLTTSFYIDTLTTKYANDPAVNFIGAESVLDYTLYQQNIPAERFNIYMDFSYTDLIYSADSTPPNAAESFVILRDSINEDYILKYVRSATDTPFVTTNEVTFRVSTMANPNPANTTKSGNKLQDAPDGGDDESDEGSVPVATLAATSAAALLILATGLLVYRRKRSSRLRGGGYDGIYAVDGKALEGYFSERSVTDESESASRFPPLPMVKEEESRPLQVRV